MPAAQAITSTTQQFLEVFDITDDLLLLKSGAASLVISVTAMNFGLLAEEEQDAIIYGYAALLNSLNYSVQIVIRSQTKDVSNYLNLLKLKEEETLNRLRKEQIRRYREFVADLVQERNVLDKKFYVVVPATPLELGIVSTQSVIPGVKNADISTFDRSVILERAKNLLEPKRDHLMSQFARIGLFSTQLHTQELIQLFYSIYNPETDGQKMTDTRQYTSSLVEGSEEEVRVAGTRSVTPDSMQKTPAQSQAGNKQFRNSFTQAPPVKPPFNPVQLPQFQDQALQPQATVTQSAEQVFIQAPTQTELTPAATQQPFQSPLGQTPMPEQLVSQPAAESSQLQPPAPLPPTENLPAPVEIT